MPVQLLKLNQIRIDGGTQPRAQLNEAVVDQYAGDLRDGAELPPLTVFFDGTDYWLVDGFHRYNAYAKLGRIELDADVREGTQRDAVLYSVGANAAHGLQRTNADKRRSVETLLNDAEWVRWSNEVIAKVCVVSSHTVAEVRQSISANAEMPATRIVERNGKTYQQDTTKIGKAKAKRAAEGKQPAASVVAASAWPYPVAPVDPAVDPDDDQPDDKSEVRAGDGATAKPMTERCTPEVEVVRNDYDALIDANDKVALRDVLVKQGSEIVRLNDEVLTLKGALEHFVCSVRDAVEHSCKPGTMRSKLDSLLKCAPAKEIQKPGASAAKPTPRRKTKAACSSDQVMREELERNGQQRLINDDQVVATRAQSDEPGSDINDHFLQEAQRV